MNTNYNPYENYDQNQYMQENYGGYLPAPVPMPEPTPVKKKSGAGKTIALALCCSLLGGIVGASGVFFGTAALRGSEAYPSYSPSTILEGNRVKTPLNITHVNTDEKLTASEIYAQNVNSTVGITTSISTNFFGYRTTSAASGSGFILSSDGYIITNRHVIEGASTVKVTMYDDTSYEAVIVGSDESNDIAVLKIEADGLTPVVLGSSDMLNVGDDVVAIGNPLGELTFSQTKGTVSALGREITMSSGNSMTLIQTDCAINSGNSGGALFNMYGEVVGITNAKYSNSGLAEASIDNIGFAIPIDNVKNIIMSIIEKGYVAKPYIGVSIENVSDEMQGFGLPQGAVIRSVAGGSPADKAGLRVNDIVTAVNGEPITGSSDLKAKVSESDIGAELSLTVYRQGESVELTLTVGEQISSSGQESAAESEQQTPPNGYGYSFPWEWFFG